MPVGRIVTITGATGTGKSEIVRVLLTDPLQRIGLIPCCTTRPPIKSDIRGEYREVLSFESMSFGNRKLYIWDTYHSGAQYALSICDVDRALKSDHQWVIILSPEHVEKLFSYCALLNLRKQILPIFLEAPTQKTLRRRMDKRGDPPDFIQSRLESEREWTSVAKASAVPFHFVPSGTFEKVLVNVFELV
ncbi:MAG: hypothetical protein AB199_03365 [Parcubacteria bacterium C7867-004]|nr:MAG: hypothetical protein AB199_03365 [Parcubacteria bacterium C7867-004]